MKAILLNSAEITSISAKKDKSIGFRVETPELTDEHRAAFFKLQGVNVKLLIEPLDTEAEPPVEVKTEREHKTCSQRLRAALFVYFQQLGSPGDFQTFYNAKMEKAISEVKAKLD